MVIQRENVLDTTTPIAEDSLLDEIMAQTKMVPEEEGIMSLKKGWLLLSKTCLLKDMRKITCTSSWLIKCCLKSIKNQ
ncbi:hypothetical protein JCM19233_7088 [Vibrio astriarenae]|nr:hypothetical protein JCM19233_7088 [Vibrio sp. C7]